MRDDLGGATGELGAVVGPYTLAPVAVAAGLGGQQVKQRPTVPRVTGGTGPGQEPVVEQRAGPLHRDQDLVITADPGPVGGPAATLPAEAGGLWTAAARCRRPAGRGRPRVSAAARCGADRAAGWPAGRPAGCRWRTTA